MGNFSPKARASEPATGGFSAPMTARPSGREAGVRATADVADGFDEGELDTRRGLRSGLAPGADGA